MKNVVHFTIAYGCFCPPQCIKIGKCWCADQYIGLLFIGPNFSANQESRSYNDAEILTFSGHAGFLINSFAWNHSRTFKVDVHPV